MNRILLQPAFILHARPYRDTSLLLDIFSQDQGRVHLIARGARNTKSKTGRLLQPFSPLLLSWQGRTELMTLTQVEAQSVSYSLRGEAVLCAFYLNEMMVRVIHRGDPYLRLYKIYETTLQCLSQSVKMAPILRLFEKHLLIELGYALSLDHDLNGNPIDPKKNYIFIPTSGFQCFSSERVTHAVSSFSGESLLALRDEHFESQKILKEVTQLMRLALAPLLGEKPLKSRECFI